MGPTLYGMEHVIPGSWDITRLHMAGPFRSHEGIAGWLMEHPSMDDCRVPPPWLRKPPSDCYPFKESDFFRDVKWSWLVQQDSFTTPRAVVSLRFFNCYRALSVILTAVYPPMMYHIAMENCLFSLIIYWLNMMNMESFYLTQLCYKLQEGTRTDTTLFNFNGTSKLIWMSNQLPC